MVWIAIERLRYSLNNNEGAKRKSKYLFFFLLQLLSSNNLKEYFIRKFP